MCNIVNKLTVYVRKVNVNHQINNRIKKGVAISV